MMTNEEVKEPLEKKPPVKDWKLKSLSIQYRDYGKFAGHYTGKIAFENGQEDEFVFQLSPGMVAPYIHLISNEIARSANKLGEKLIWSIGANVPADTTSTSTTPS